MDNVEFNDKSLYLLLLIDLKINSLVTRQLERVSLVFIQLEVFADIVYLDQAGALSVENVGQMDEDGLRTFYCYLIIPVLIMYLHKPKDIIIILVQLVLGLDFQHSEIFLEAEIQLSGRRYANLKDNAFVRVKKYQLALVYLKVLVSLVGEWNYLDFDLIGLRGFQRQKVIAV